MDTDAYQSLPVVGSLSCSHSSFSRKGLQHSGSPIVCQPHRGKLCSEYEMHPLILYYPCKNMLLWSSLLSHCQSLCGLGGIIDRPKGVKSRLGLSRFGFPVWRTTELQEDILSGGVLALSEQLCVDAHGVCEGIQYE